SRYGVGESTITDILKKQHHYLLLSPNNYTASLCREKPSKYPAVEQALALWIDQVVDGNCSLSGHIVIQKAVTFAQRLGAMNTQIHSATNDSPYHVFAQRPRSNWSLLSELESMGIIDEEDILDN
ncbi:8027_t:CDS:2, partial [Paraglomus brasilianum]